MIGKRVGISFFSAGNFYAVQVFCVSVYSTDLLKSLMKNDI